MLSDQPSCIAEVGEVFETPFARLLPMWVCTGGQEGSWLIPGDAVGNAEYFCFIEWRMTPLLILQEEGSRNSTLAKASVTHGASQREQRTISLTLRNTWGLFPSRWVCVAPRRRHERA